MLVKFKRRNIKKSLLKRYGKMINQLSEKEIKYLSNITIYLDRLEDSFDVIYDIGANSGIWSEAFALYSKKAVHAFEPLPAMIQDIEKRKKRCQLINIHHVACGNQNMESFINENEYKSEASSIMNVANISKEEWPKIGLSHKVPVKIVRLDEYRELHKLPIPTLIKIDVQGYELNVIQGAQNTIKKTKYLWVELNLKELYVNGSTFKTIYKLLVHLGFELIDCIDLNRSKINGKLLYMDGIFQNKLLKDNI